MNAHNAQLMMFSALMSAFVGVVVGLTRSKPVAAPAAALPRVELACQLVRTPGQGVELQVRHRGGPALAPGERIAWATLGTPQPIGDIVVLPQGLARGGHLAVPATPALRGAGCRAEALA